MATYDQSQLSPEKIRGARVLHLEKFAGDISIFWKAGEQQRYQEAMQLATQLAILNADRFGQIREGGKRAAFRDHLATFNWYNVNKTTGEISKTFNY